MDKKFNKYISGIAASSGWSTPLYFGNFYNGNDGPYATSSHNGGYMNAKDGLTNWNHAPNNSRKGFTDHDCKTDESGTTVGLDREHQSYQGLVDSTLKDGNLTVAGGTTAPYFQANDTYVKEFQSSFPFREDTHTDYTKYIFKSSTSNNKKPSDNVYFNWSGNTPTDVNYNYGSAHAVKDGRRTARHTAISTPALTTAIRRSANGQTSSATSWALRVRAGRAPRWNL